MGTAKISFEIGSNSVTLYFGMTSVNIFQQKSFEEVVRMDAQGIKANAENVDNIKVFAYVIYSGMCNWADLNDEMRPKYADSYIVAEQLLRKENESLQLDIWEVWKNSQPVAEMLERLNPNSQDTGNKKRASKKK